jgi:hypothetical protein
MELKRKLITRICCSVSKENEIDKNFFKEFFYLFLFDTTFLGLICLSLC